MSWVKIDDSLARNRKVRQVSDKAFRVYINGLCYCAEHLTDGYVDDIALAEVGFSAQVPGRRLGHIVTELVEIGLWHLNGSGYVVNDYLAFNPSRGQVEEHRRKALERKHKERGVTP